jgi:hypothetical protein
MQLTLARRSLKPARCHLALPIALAVLGCDSVPDNAALRTLARDELIGLCDDLEDELSTPPSVIECTDGWTGLLVPPNDFTCRYLDLSGCGATAGDLRACHRAAFADPCAAMHAVPAECFPLWTRGCMPFITGSPILAGCPAISPAALESLEGIYEIVRHTENLSSCSVEGESVLSRDAQRLLLVIGVTFAGAPVSIVESCADLSECRQRSEEIRNAPPYTSRSAELERSLGCDLDTVGAVHGEVQSFQFHDGGSCTGSLIETTATLPSSGSLRLEDRTKQWSTFEEFGDCNFRRGDPPVEAAECSSLEVYEARLLSEI